MVAYVQSFSMVAKQPPHVREEVAKQIRAVLALPETQPHRREREGVTLYHMPMSMRFIWLEALA